MNEMSLKDIAQMSATDADVKQPALESEMDNHIMETTESKSADDMTVNVGGTELVIGNPKRNTTVINDKSEVNKEAESLMKTPTPSMVGLTPEMINAQSSVDLKSMGIQNGSSVKTNMSNEQTLRDEQLAMLAELAPEMPEEERIKRCTPLLNEFEKIMKDLIVNFGLSPEDAKTGAMNRVKNNIRDNYEEYMKENPNLGVITIDKTQDANDLSLTTEEHQKLERVKKIRLVMVEDADLANITIERPDEKHKSDYVKSIDGTVAKYSVPLPMLGDFVAFKGAQIIQMVNIINYEDARIDEIINNKASLIYEKLVDGSILKKFNNNRNNDKMTYMEFINKFPYQDIDMALYAIVCASAMEESSTSLTCESCSHTWDHKYNIKSLLKLDDLSEYYKDRVDKIIANKGNDAVLRQMYDDRRKARRYRSPFTNNVYDMSYPTVARATNLLKRINQEDNVMSYISAIALYLSRILIYNPKKNSYIEINADETDLMLETMQTLTNDDMNMLASQIRDDFFYRATFAMDVECPSCHKKSTLPLNIENLIFLMAQDSMVEIEG